ncbi:hypothetical protein RvY_08238-1 [Ramazzottius varieornatus]|uniref:C2 domain-containing protein n=1 Tax=Ramazzottius varieornatus TaxID=947166 RepID=A0A1D1V555_RAMVA|nr:hypothetical protein RvY_08238-1 [Ramazzottius varieornatus]
MPSRRNIKSQNKQREQMNRMGINNQWQDLGQNERQHNAEPFGMNRGGRGKRGMGRQQQNQGSYYSTDSGEVSKTSSPGGRSGRTPESRTMRRRRSSLMPTISINVTGADDDDETMNIDAIQLTLSPSENSMADPKYWDNPVPDQTLRLKPPQRDRLYNRRRSSALSNLSNEPGLSRSTYSLCEKGLYEVSKEKILIDRRLSLAPQLAIAQISQMEKPKKSRSANRLESKLIADMGELKISVQYIPEKSGLKVTVIKGENIGGRYKTDALVNPIVSAMLLPGKLQKQTGKLIKVTKNPVFNDEFFFADMDWELLETHMLRISVQNQQRFNNDDLGELLLPVLRLDPESMSMLSSTGPVGFPCIFGHFRVPYSALVHVQSIPPYEMVHQKFFGLV